MDQFICILVLASALFGITIGSFLNVLILRVPAHENFITKRSHCMNCNTELHWYELIPVFSWLFLKGKCRTCKSKISIQYPIIEAANGLLYVVVFLVKGLNVESLLYCLLCSALLALSVIDFRTYEIPVGFNIFIGILGIVRVVLDYQNWLDYVIGLFSVSVFLLILYLLSKGRAIGGGDIKLMAATGLLLGWKLNVLSFALGCILGAIIHVIRMKVSGEGKQLAMGPYLSLGILISLLVGDYFINWYISLFSNI